MKIEFKEIENKKDLEIVLNRFDYSTMFLSWEWSRFEKALGSDFRIYVAYKDGKPKALLPIKFVRAKRGRYLHLRHGPLMEWEDKTFVKKVLNFVKKLATREEMHFIRISPLVKASQEIKDFFKSQRFKDSVIHATDAELTITVDLTKSENANDGDPTKMDFQNVEKHEI